MNFTQQPHLEAMLQNMTAFKDYLTQYNFLEQTINCHSSEQVSNTQTSLAQTMAKNDLYHLTVGDLDQHINDLKIVLKFMEINTTVLRQHLEKLTVQRQLLDTSSIHPNH